METEGGREKDTRIAAYSRPICNAPSIIKKASTTYARDSTQQGHVTWRARARLLEGGREERRRTERRVL
eukprot:2465364-Rhodomonas_salina.1